MAFLKSNYSLGICERWCRQRTTGVGGLSVAPCPENVSGGILMRTRKHSFPSGWVCLVALLLSAVMTSAGAPTPREIDVKAVYLLRFAEYVDWPPESFASQNSPIIIGVLGDRNMRQALDAVIEGEQVRNRPFRVQTLNRVEDARNCHIVFLGQAEAGSMDELMRRLRNAPILTVSDWERFDDRGGMIRFVNEGGKIRLHINLDAARTARLGLSSRLLRVADAVKETRREP
jgi:hypothetical protein